MPELKPVELVPVSQWVYDLYKVSYWTCDGGQLLKTQHFAASNESHMWSAANENAPGDHCEWMTWEVVKENVGHPRVVGNLYGLSIHECAASHGRRLTS
jgi:hypothetical protein